MSTKTISTLALNISWIKKIFCNLLLCLHTIIYWIHNSIQINWKRWILWWNFFGLRIFFQITRYFKLEVSYMFSLNILYSGFILERPWQIWSSGIWLLFLSKFGFGFIQFYCFKNYNPIFITYVPFILKRNLLSRMFNLVLSYTWQAMFFAYH